MKIYDISQELMECRIYPGDPAPQKKQLRSIENGDGYNLTEITVCVHNGTHIDAPSHFIKGGKTVDMIALEKAVGLAFVAEERGLITADRAERILERARRLNAKSAKRILIKGDAVLLSDGARMLAECGTELVGSESQSVGPEDAPAEVHRILLENETVLLEGIRLDRVPEGVYFLNAAPLSIEGSDGSPCRAILIDGEHEFC